MKYRINKKLFTALFLAALMVCSPITTYAALFADMTDVPWPGAETPINKAAELGLVVGETIDGKSYFRPKNPVSLSQVCQLAYKLLLETDKATADAEVITKWTPTMNTYKIQSWAHPAVSYCLDKNIISIVDLTGFVSGEYNVSATREQAAEILGRALIVGIPGTIANAASTKFADNGRIAADAIPYIALLNEKGIINGDTENKFNPKNNLNRTETAVMVTNLYDALKAATPIVKQPTTKAGKVTALTNLYATLDTGSTYLFSSSAVKATLNGAASTVADLITLIKNETALNATLTIDDSGKITGIAATAEIKASSTTKEKETKGNITSITFDEDDDSGILKINGTTVYRVEYANDINIEITDQDGDTEDYYWDELIELYDECKDKKKTISVELELYSDGDLKKIVGKIVNASDEEISARKGEGKGIISDVTYEENEPDAKLKIGSSTYKTSDLEDVDIEITDGKETIDTWQMLYEAERDGKTMDVTLTLDSEEITKIRGKVTKAKGYLDSFSNEYLRLEGKKSLQTSKYIFTDYNRSDDSEKTKWEKAVKDIKVTGLPNISNLYDFFEVWLDDEETNLNKDKFMMTFELNSKGYITKIEGELID